MPYTNYLRWALIGGLCAVPFISFIIAGGSGVPNMFFPFITGKNFVFRILVEVLLLLYVVLALREPKYRPKSSLLMWAAAGFAAWMALATVLSVDPVKSFWSNFERMDGYVTLIHAFALFVVAGAVLTAEKWWEKFFNITITVAALQGINALFQLMHLFGFAPSSQSGARIDTTFGNAIYVAVFMLFAVFITLYMLVREKREPWLQSLYGIALVLEGLALFYSQTRGALLGVVIGLVIMGIYIALRAREPQWRVLRVWSMGLLAALVVVGGLFFALRDSSFVKASPTLNRIASISLSDPTTQARFTIWTDMAIPGAMERPVFGWGQENFSYIFNKYYVPSMYSQEAWFDRTHNEFLDWLVAGGIPAFVLYVALFVLAAWAIVRSPLTAPAQGAMLGLLAAYAFSNLTVFHDLMSFVYFFIIIAFAHGMSARPLPRFMVFSKPLGDHGVAIAAPLVAIVVLGGAWALNASGIARAQTILQAIQPGAAGTDVGPRLGAFKLALTQGELGRQEVVEQLLQFADTLPSSSSVSPDTKEEVYDVALSAGDDMLAQRTGDARLELFMGLFLSQFGQYDEALAHLAKASALSPNKQQILFQEGQAYIQKGDTQNGLATFKKAFDLAPEYDLARISYASALYYAGQTAPADKLLIEGFGTTTVDSDQLVQTYTNTKQYGRLIAVWVMRVAANPKDPNTHLQLAAAYFAAGNTAQTVAELEQVATLNPAAAAQIQSLIANIKSGKLKFGQ